MGQLGKLEMKFENDDKFVELKMHHIDPEMQFKIMELCMKAVHNLKEKQEEQEEEKPVVISKHTGQTEEEIKEGYQLFKKPVLEVVEPIINKAPRINTYQPDKSIRIFNGVKHYQCFYICPDCGNKGKHYITPGTPSVQCHKYNCGHEMMVRLATHKGLPDHDEWGNYYVSGEFKMSMKDKEDEDDFLQENRENESITVTN